jgi:hypothetical protein
MFSNNLEIIYITEGIQPCKGHKPHLYIAMGGMLYTTLVTMNMNDAFSKVYMDKQPIFLQLLA